MNYTERSALVKRYTYDAWGKRTLITDNTGTDKPLFSRGFTGHEHLDDFYLINMNGRMYDPLTSSFLSPDPFVQSPDFTQSYNRYSYCLNNPLKYTDPSGYTTQMSLGKAFFQLYYESTYGGTWESNGDASGGNVTTFSNPGQAMQSAVDYNNFHDSWGNTKFQHGANVSSQNYFARASYRGLRNFGYNPVTAYYKSIGTDYRYVAGRSGEPGDPPLKNNQVIYNYLGTADFSNGVVGIPIGLKEMYWSGAAYDARRVRTFYPRHWNGELMTGTRVAAKNYILCKQTANFFKYVGVSGFIIGTFISTAQFVVKPTIRQGLNSSLDIGYGFLGTFGGPFGFGISSMYFVGKYNSPNDDPIEGLIQLSNERIKLINQGIYQWHGPR